MALIDELLLQITILAEICIKMHYFCYEKLQKIAQQKGMKRYDM